MWEGSSNHWRRDVMGKKWGHVLLLLTVSHDSVSKSFEKWMGLRPRSSWEHPGISEGNNKRANQEKLKCAYEEISWDYSAWGSFAKWWKKKKIWTCVKLSRVRQKLQARPSPADEQSQRRWGLSRPCLGSMSDCPGRGLLRRQPQWFSLSSLHGAKDVFQFGHRNFPGRGAAEVRAILWSQKNIWIWILVHSCHLGQVT